MQNKPVYNLCLPLDRMDLKKHPHVVFHIDEDNFYFYKIVSMKRKFLMPPYNKITIILRPPHFSCFDHVSVIFINQVKVVEAFNLIKGKHYFWKCSNELCKKCPFGRQMKLDFSSIKKEMDYKLSMLDLIEWEDGKFDTDFRITQTVKRFSNEEFSIHNFIYKK